MCELSPKKPNIEEKKPNNFFTPTASIKAKFVKVGVKKLNWQPRTVKYCGLQVISSFPTDARTY